MWKEAVLPLLEVLSRYWHAGTEKKRDKLQSRYLVSCPRFGPKPFAVRNSSFSFFSVFLRGKEKNREHLSEGTCSNRVSKYVLT